LLFFSGTLPFYGHGVAAGELLDQGSINNGDEVASAATRFTAGSQDYEQAEHSNLRHPRANNKARELIASGVKGDDSTVCRGCKKDLYNGTFVGCDDSLVYNNKKDCGSIGGTGNCEFQPIITDITLEQCETFCQEEAGCTHFLHSGGVSRCILYLVSGCILERSNPWLLSKVYELPGTSAPPPQDPTPGGPPAVLVASDTSMSECRGCVKNHWSGTYNYCVDSSTNNKKDCEWFGGPGDCEFPGIRNSISLQACENFCRVEEGCTYFAHHPTLGFCELYLVKDCDIDDRPTGTYNLYGFEPTPVSYIVLWSAKWIVLIKVTNIYPSPCTGPNPSTCRGTNPSTCRGTHQQATCS
jgi:hypothetical protein